MTKKLIAPLLAMSLVFTGIGVAPVRAGNQDDLGKFIAGAIAIAIIAKAIEQSKARNRPHVPALIKPTPLPSPAPQPAPPPQPVYYILPAECFFKVRNQTGRRGVYGKICLQETMRQAGRLPGVCEDTVRVRYGLRSRIYDATCLREQGFRREARL